METMSLVLFLICTVVVPYFVSWYVCPPMVRLAKEKNLTDCPGNRKLQKKPVPVVGGVCVFCAVVISLALCCALGGVVDWGLNIGLNVLVAFAMIFLIGFFDDMVDLSAYVKFVFQFLTIYLLISSGYVVDSFNGLFGVDELPRWAAVALSLFAGVGLMNAVNMIDGVNGLSSSVGMSFCVVSATLLMLMGDWTNAAVALIFMASLVPFFIANAFSYKYKMFIGDSGALMLGTLAYMLVCSLLHGVQGGELGEATCSHSVALVVSVFAIPVFDTLRVMTMRMLRGRSPFSADKTHLHHILLELKLPHLAVTATILILGLVVFGSWLATNWLIEQAWLQLLVVVLVAVVCSWGTYWFLARSRDKHDERFQRIIEALTGVSERVRSFRKGIEAKYDSRMDKKGYAVLDFDVDDAMIQAILRKVNIDKKYTVMNGTDYHAIDQEKILKYVASAAEVSVEDIIKSSGAEKLRVYPILFELEQARVIEVRRRGGLGAPEVVSLVKE